MVMWARATRWIKPSLLMAALAMPLGLTAAELQLGEGVVVKFAPDTGFTVRDKLTASGVALTSLKDDTLSGQTSATPQSPARGDWKGIRVEASSTGLQLDNSSIRYTDIGLEMRKVSPALKFFQVSDSNTGIRLTDAASPQLSSIDLLNNITGLLAEGNANPVIGAAQIQGNTTAISNLTPTTIIKAENNWWGDASGPKATDNAAGKGNPVSAGVDYAPWGNGVPLGTASVAVQGNPSFVANADITLLLGCRNAKEYRLSSSSDFTGIPFQPMAASAAYSLPGGDGSKTVYAEFRDATGNNTVKASASILKDIDGPALAITNPSNGAFLTGAIDIEASANDPAGVQKVEFYIDAASSPLCTDSVAPFVCHWDVAVADGAHTIKLVAYDTVGHVTAVERGISKGTAPPDNSGPTISNLKFGVDALVGGYVAKRAARLSLNTSDPSGSSRVDFLLDSAPLGTDNNNSGSYVLDWDPVTTTDGPHSLTFRAYDSAGNVAEQTVSIVVQLDPPAIPTITSPASGSSTGQKNLAVSGAAVAGTTVQLYVNGVTDGTRLPVSAGSYSGSVILAEGANQITAKSSWSSRTAESAASGAVSVTLDSSIPVAPTGLSATANAGGKIHLVWNRSLDANVVGYDVYRAPTPFSVIGEASKANVSLINATVFDDAPVSEGTHYYRVVARNKLSTASATSNQAQAVVDFTAPKATAITYAASGKYDVATNRYGQGHLDVTLTVSEPLLTTPFLSLAADGGATISVSLTQSGPTQYTGAFDIGANTVAGTYTPNFSARDLVNNRGTEVASGTSIKIDTKAPNVVALIVAPAAPIKNDGSGSKGVQFTLKLDEPLKAGTQPQLAFQLSGHGATSTAITDVSGSGLDWTGSLQLPADAGATPENLKFTYTGTDDLDNVSHLISVANSFQVYLNGLPPLAYPLNFKAAALKGGKAKLSWDPVADAAGYQIYRMAPGDASLLAYKRVTEANYLDATVDGEYRYAVATIRNQNGDESLSDKTNEIVVRVDSIAPVAPKNLQLGVGGAGLWAKWEDGGNSEAVTYQLYRSTGSVISTVEGLTPIKVGITQLFAWDTNPSLLEHAYAVTAVDAAGNESAPISGFKDAVLLPVKNLSVVQEDSKAPRITWEAGGATTVGYDVFLGADAAKLKLNDAQLGVTSFADQGYTGDERLYTVTAYDAQSEKIDRAITLPKLTAKLLSGLPIQRGQMNRLQYEVSNASTARVDNLRLKVLLGGKDHSSALISLNAGETKQVAVVVGGYDTLPDSNVDLKLTLQVDPEEGAQVRIIRNSKVDATNGGFVLGATTEQFTRGATGKLRFTLENTSQVDVELVTANSNGNADSDEMRVKMLDKDGNVLSVQAVRQALGTGIVTLASGKSVARLQPGERFTSEPVTIAVPGASPDNVTVQVEADKLHYHTGQADEVVIRGISTRQAASLVETTYYGEISSITPANSYGDQDIVISGRAVDRVSGVPSAGAVLKLVLGINGFEKSYSTNADSSGNFSYTYKPRVNDAGVFTVSAVHPDVQDRPNQGQFTINRVSVAPTQVNISIPRNYTQRVDLKVTAADGTATNNVHLVFAAADQPGGALPTGISVNPVSPISLLSRQSGNLSFDLSGDSNANASGSLKLKVLSDERGSTPLAIITVSYVLSDAKPALFFSPSLIQTGVALGSSSTETVTLDNRGYAPLNNLKVELLDDLGSKAPDWVYLATSGDLGNLAVGGKRTVDVVFAPPVGTAVGDKHFKLHVKGDGIPDQDYNLYAAITESGQGSILFKVSDIYTNTKDTTTGQLIQGLAGAQIEFENEDASVGIQKATTDARGEALLQNTAAGAYKYRISAPNHQEVIGRIRIKPGITLSQGIFLDYNLVTVRWTVKEITIEDTYEITLNATFETNVPAAVVVLEPASVTLPKMKTGDVFQGELTLTNYGLVRADHLKGALPGNDGNFRYEFLNQIPDSLGAKERITLPYRVISVKSLEPDAAATGGGCATYSASLVTNYSYVCANGTETGGSASTTWVTTYGDTCGGGGGSGGVGGVGSGAGGGSGGYSVGGPSGGGGAALPPSTSLPGAKCVPVCPTCESKKGE